MAQVQQSVAAPAPVVVPAAMAQPPLTVGAPTYSMASLYVGDLHPEVTEAMLFEKFSLAGPVLSIRVCRDNASRISLGYAYVNFQQPADAERALDTMNFELINGRPMRIMWSQRDPAARKAGNGNIFIKNLDKVIDNKSIYDTFSLFGNILSCKVAVDDDGISKGYGFVHFETDASALSAIERVNGMLLAGKKVYVGKFKSRAERMKEFGDVVRKFTNVFIKNFGEHLDTEKLIKLFSKFGTISSATVMVNSDGKPKGFGFVAFEQPEDAVKAVDEMNDTVLEGTDLKLVVCRAQKKAERHAEMKKKYDALKQERVQKYQGVNLYVKNIDENMTDEELKQHFTSFGTITSAKVMIDENGRSKGFGFVCFEKPEEATNAVTEMNSKMIGNKPLYVALAQRKEDRRAQLASQFMQRLATLRMQNQNMPAIYPPGQAGFFVANPIAPPGHFAPQQTAIRAGQRMFQNSQMFVQYPFSNAPRNMYANNRNAVPPIRNGNEQQQGQQPHQRQSFGSVPQRGNNQATRYGQQYNQQQITRQNTQPRGSSQKQYYAPHQQRAQQNSGIVISGQEPLTSHMLAQAAPQEQKQLLGERIYALIEKMFPGHRDAGKITGMMLEIDNSEIIMMLSDDDLFRSKFDEASTVLSQANQNATN